MRVEALPMDIRSISHQVFVTWLSALMTAIFEPKLVRHTAESPDDDIPKMFMECLESDIEDIYDKFKIP